MSTRAWAFLWPLLCLLVACGSPIVGAECRHGFVRCDGQCVDLQSDPDNCNACGHSCGALECSAGECGPRLRDGGTDDGRYVDGGADGAGMDASVDGGRSGPGLGKGTAGSPFSPDAGASFPGCGLGERECAGECSNPEIDTSHCGGCGIACGAAQFCINGMCEDRCDLPLHLCHGGCVDYQTDVNNCGGCGHVCLSGICTDGVCADVIPGSLVVIGHDYSAATASIPPAVKRIASNTAFLPFGAASALVYRGKAKSASCNGVLNAIQIAADNPKRDWETTDVAADQVTEQLREAQVFIICAQAGASDAQLQKLGETWSLAMAQFLYRGGVIALFETQTANNTGTYHLLEAAGLFSAASREPIAPARQKLFVQGPPLGVTANVPNPYITNPTTVHFLGVQSDGLVVVRDTAGEAVVIHRLISP